MKQLEIYLFNQFCICCGQEKLTVIKARKAQELFCYLLLHPGRAHHREALADILWGENQQGKKYLRKAIWQLQTFLKPLQNVIETPILLVDQDWLQIHPEARIWVDTQAFMTAHQAVSNLSGSELSELEFTSLCEILNLYIGDLLEGIYSDWCIHERERYREIYLSLANKLMNYCLVHQEYAQGVCFGKLILQADQVHERCHRKLMRMHYFSNNRVAAIRQYRACKAALAEELSVEPSQLTNNLYQQILNEQLPVLHSSSKSQQQVSPSQERMHHLLEIQAAIHPRS